jgi:hypothetical protein
MYIQCIGNKFQVYCTLKVQEIPIVIRQSCLLLILFLPGILCAQQIVGVRAGMIQYIIGDVFLEGKSAQIPKNGYLQMEAGQQLNTRSGLAELQLSPGAYLRLGENTSIRMIENRLGMTQLRLNQGAIVIEAVDGSAANPVLVSVSGAAARIERDGLYRLNVAPGDIRVYSGEIVVSGNGKSSLIRNGKMARLMGNFKPEKFDAGDSDALHQWSAQRSFDLFNLTPETRKQTHWVPTSAGWVWNSAYRTSRYSELFYLKWVKDEANRRIQELREKYDRDSETRTVNGSEYEELLSGIKEAQNAIQAADRKAKQLDASTGKPQFR